MKITLAQLNPVIGDFKGNAEKIKRAIQKAQNEHSDILCLPEMFLTGYPPRDLLERADFTEQAARTLQDLVQYTKQIPDLAVICGTVIPAAEDSQKELLNAAVVLLEGKVIFSQAKTLLPAYDVFDETRYFQSSDTFALFHWKDEKIGLTICEDAWNDPEVYFDGAYHVNPVQEMVKRGATLIINLSASPFCTGKIDLRFQLIKNHVARHRIPFVLVNQIGGQDELIFDGNSLVLDSKGRLLCRLPGFEECISTIDLNQKSAVVANPIPLIESVYHALILGLRDYLDKCGFSKVFIGLSGGIDSSLVACIAAEAAGAENVIGVAMPSQYSSEGSLKDAQKLAGNLNIALKTVPIHDIYKSYLQSLQSHFEGMPENVTEENIQARIRGNILMAFSNKYGGLTLATGNKSELSVGYCTMYGDMSGGLSVIGDVPKTLVYKMSRYINQKKEIIPESIITKPPSAELKPDQKDEDTLPPYETLDRIIDLYVDQMKSFSEIVDENLDPETVRWTIQNITKNEYKRRQAAPILKVTSKAFGMGRRMPIAAKYIL